MRQRLALGNKIAESMRPERIVVVNQTTFDLDVDVEHGPFDPDLTETDVAVPEEGQQEATPAE
jgi:hypothetical protein